MDFEVAALVAAPVSATPSSPSCSSPAAASAAFAAASDLSTLALTPFWPGTAQAFQRRLGAFGAAEYERLLAFLMEAAEAEEESALRAGGRRGVKRKKENVPPVSLRLLVEVLRLGECDWADFERLAGRLSWRLPQASGAEVRAALDAAHACFEGRVTQSAAEWAQSGVLYRRWLRSAARRCEQAAHHSGTL